MKYELPASAIVSAQPYQPGTTTLAPQVTAIKSAGAQVLVDFTVPIYTAIGQLTAFTLGYSPQLVVSSVGIDPTTVASLLKTVSRARPVARADRRRHTRPAIYRAANDVSNAWIQLFKKVKPNTTRARRLTATWSTAWRTRTRWCRRCRPPARTSRAKTRQGGQRKRREVAGPGWSFRYSTTQPRRLRWCRHGQRTEEQRAPPGRPAHSSSEQTSGVRSHFGPDRRRRRSRGCRNPGRGSPRPSSRPRPWRAGRTERTSCSRRRRERPRQGGAAPDNPDAMSRPSPAPPHRAPSTHATSRPNGRRLGGARLCRGHRHSSSGDGDRVEALDREPPVHLAAGTSTRRRR